MQQSGFVLADGETPVPVTVPDVKLSAVIRDQELIAEAAFINQTADIWILHWEAGLVGEGVQTAAPTPLIWLEAGVAFTDEAAWLLNGTQSSSLDWHCAAYRVTADILQWLDEEHLSPGEEGYERQQELLQAAYEAGALIIAAGNWPAGSAGEIRLILPDNCEETDVLSYYVTIGALEEPKTQSSTLTAK